MAINLCIRERQMRLLCRNFFITFNFLLFLTFGVFGLKEIIVSRGLERSPSDVWPLPRFHVSLWALIMKLFCNYPLTLLFFFDIRECSDQHACTSNILTGQPLDPTTFGCHETPRILNPRYVTIMDRTHYSI